MKKGKGLKVLLVTLGVLGILSIMTAGNGYAVPSLKRKTVSLLKKIHV